MSATPPRPFSGSVPVPARVLASAGACMVLGAVAVGLSVANRSIDPAQTKGTGKDWANFAIGSAFDIGVSRIPGARRAIPGLLKAARPVRSIRLGGRPLMNLWGGRHVRGTRFNPRVGLAQFAGWSIANHWPLNIF
jgi:hypothetical protein